MLRKGFLTSGQAGLRPLVWLAVAALVTSTAPVRAEPTASRAVAPARVEPVASQPVPSAPAAPAPHPPPKDDGAGLRTAGYIAGGVGIVGFIVFAVAGIGAKNAYDRLEDARQFCGAARDCPEAAGPSSDGKRQQAIANIGLATGLLGVGLGATFLMLGAHPSHDTPAVASGPRGGMITLSGRF